jgi:hypothetical protein
LRPAGPAEPRQLHACGAENPSREATDPGSSKNAPDKFQEAVGDVINQPVPGEQEYHDAHGGGDCFGLGQNPVIVIVGAQMHCHCPPQSRQARKML